MRVGVPLYRRALMTLVVTADACRGERFWLLGSP
jgi:hypothetical protein